MVLEAGLASWLRAKVYGLFWFWVTTRHVSFCARIRRSMSMFPEAIKVFAQIGHKIGQFSQSSSYCPEYKRIIFRLDRPDSLLNWDHGQQTYLHEIGQIIDLLSINPSIMSAFEW